MHRLLRSHLLGFTLLCAALLWMLYLLRLILNGSTWIYLD